MISFADPQNYKCSRFSRGMRWPIFRMNVIYSAKERENEKLSEKKPH